MSKYIRGKRSLSLSLSPGASSLTCGTKFAAAPHHTKRVQELEPLDIGPLRALCVCVCVCVCVYVCVSVSEKGGDGKKEKVEGRGRGVKGCVVLFSSILWGGLRHT
jgi:hypothetical protein